MNHKQMNRLEQIIREDEHNRVNVRRNIKNALEAHMDKTFLQKAVNAIDDYLMGDYYASKNGRIAHIRHISPEDLMLEVMTVMCSIEEPVIIQGPASSIGARLEYEDIFDGVKTAAELISVCAIAGLINIFKAGTELESIAVVSKINLDQEEKDFLARVHYPDPLVCQPDHWVSNTGGGYITANDSVLLGKQTHHSDKQGLDVLNILQDIAWELDPDVLNEAEESKKPLDTFEKQEAWNEMARMSRKVYKDMMNGPLWFQWQYDFRGRAYSRGYYINLQSHSYKKALLNFAKKERVTTY